MSGWYCLAVLPPNDTLDALGAWIESTKWPEGFTPKRADRLHTTLLYSPDAHGTPQGESLRSNWAMADWAFDTWTSRVSAFTPSSQDAPTPVVLELHSFWLCEQVRALWKDADTLGINHPVYASNYQPHTTIGTLPRDVELPHIMPPHLEFQFEPAMVDLRAYYGSQRNK